MRPLLVVLVGNPNTGKSTLFNALTGDRQETGNWSGTTVERRVGFIRGTVAAQPATVELVDLPGAYSLTPYSPEERITRDFLLQRCPDLVVNVLDGANLERNLYLTVQLLETELPLMLVVNRMDVAGRRRIEIDLEKLGHLVGGVPVLSTAAAKGNGVDALRRTMIDLAARQRPCMNRAQQARIHQEIS